MKERLKKVPRGWVIIGLALLAWAILFPLGIVFFSLF